VDIVVDGGRHVKVDDVGDVGDIETTRSDVGGDEERFDALAEELERLLQEKNKKK